MLGWRRVVLLSPEGSACLLSKQVPPGSSPGTRTPAVSEGVQFPGLGAHHLGDFSLWRTTGLWGFTQPSQPLPGLAAPWLQVLYSLMELFPVIPKHPQGPSGQAGVSFYGSVRGLLSEAQTLESVTCGRACIHFNEGTVPHSMSCLVKPLAPRYPPHSAPLLPEPGHHVSGNRF